jgi:hypothetical protein
MIFLQLVFVSRRAVSGVCPLLGECPGGLRGPAELAVFSRDDAKLGAPQCSAEAVIRSCGR